MNTRKPAYPVAPYIVDRWSARAMSGESISQKELMSLFEAARWAPSSYNSQPWRFIYAHRDSPQWKTVFDLLVPFNQSWCKNAAVLVVVVSKNTFDHNGEFSSTHSFDTGAACENLALQGNMNGFVVHGMAGFDYEKARTALAIPADHMVEAMFAIGKPGPISNLPADLQKSEVKSDRKNIEQFAFDAASWQATSKN